MQESLAAMHRLRSENVGALLVYSVEVDGASGQDRCSGIGLLRDTSSEQPIHKRSVEEVINSIDTAGNFEDDVTSGSRGLGRTTCVAVKLVSACV